MLGLTAWYGRLPQRTATTVRYTLGVVTTVAFLAVYNVLVQPKHSYLIGLFPVIASAVLAGVGPALASLIITSVYIDYVITPPPNHGHGFIVLFFLEGLIVLWMVRQRQEARKRLAQNLENRESELGSLRKMHDQLVKESAHRHQSIAMLQESNRIMIDTLERILDKQHD